MNAWKLNGQAGGRYRNMICKELGISHVDIYKVVKTISNNGDILLHDGRVFRPKLEEV